MADETSARDGALEFREFSFSYGGSGSWQLQRVTLNVSPGERVAVMGATGAGKSTLAMSMNGLVPHHHHGDVDGTVTVAGSDVLTEDVRRTVRRVGLVMQDPETQIIGHTVLDDAAVGPANFGLPRDEVFARARRSLELVGIDDLADRDTSHMSGGQKQRLVIAGVLAMDSDVLVLDEPTSELDPQGTNEVFGVVRALSVDGAKTVVLVEHHPELVAAWADRLVVLTGGRVVHDGSPDDFFTNQAEVDRAGLRTPDVTAAALALSAAGRHDGPVPVTLEHALEVVERWSPDQGRAPEPQPEPPSEGAPVVVESRQLGHVYPGGVDALRQVTVSLREGDFVAVLGRNGAGKTTFARHLNGLLVPTSGELLVGGRSTRGLRVSELAATVGYVFQNPDHQIFADSVTDEVAYGLRNFGWAPDRVETRVAEVLGQVGMSHLAERHPFTLGKGERQRLAVASVLALSPQVLVIDEPTTGLDWLGAQAIMALIRELNDAGRTIVMVTHDMSLMARYARRALVFADGELIADTDPVSLFADDDLLRRGTLIPPQITQLAAGLGCPRTVTTMEDFAREWGVDRAL